MLPALAPGTRLAHKAAGGRAMHDAQARHLHGLGLRLARRRTSAAPRRRAQPTKAIGGLEAALSGVSDAAVMQAIGFGLAAVWVGLQLMLEQEEAAERQRRSESACSSCGGTGRMPCICTRWSDRDMGCGACCGSGWMECTKCGGGGTAVPIAARVYVKGDSYRRYH